MFALPRCSEFILTLGGVEDVMTFDHKAIDIIAYLPRKNKEGSSIARIAQAAVGLVLDDGIMGIVR